MRVPVVVLERDISLENYCSRKQSEAEEDKMWNVDELNESYNEVNPHSEWYNETESSNEENIQRDNTGSEVVQNNASDNVSPSESLNFMPEGGYIFVKQEIDLMEHSLPPLFEPVAQEEAQIETNIVSETEITSEYTEVIETNSSIPVKSNFNAYCNSFVPQLQVFNGVSPVPNAPIIMNTNFGPYMMLPMPQFNPNIMMTNPSYQGLFNQLPFNCFPQNMMQLAPPSFSMMPQPLMNQVFSPAQEMMKLQAAAAMFGLNSGFSPLENVFTPQSYFSNSH